MQNKPQVLETTEFNVGSRYEMKKIIGSGAYGQVALANDLQKKIKVAIKKLHKIEDIVDAKRVLREIRIMRCLKHENILALLNLIYHQNQDQEFGDIYLVMNFLDIDLYKVIKSCQQLTDEHIQYIVYQILRGLKYMHSANVVHRDLKPSNILATEKCEVQMCDFGLSRKIEEEEELEKKKEASTLTEYVVTRYYRAPEIMLSSHEYSKPVDIWSLGCSLAELLSRQILFKAKDYIKQIKLIFETLGTPEPEDLQFITNANAKKYVESLPVKPRISVKEFIKYDNKDCLDLLDKMLIINPLKRITSEEALNHKYFENLHDEVDEPIFEGEIDFKFEHDHQITLDDLRKNILEEINFYKEQNSEQLIDIKKEMTEVSKRRMIMKEQTTDLLKKQQENQKKQDVL